MKVCNGVGNGTCSTTTAVPDAEGKAHKIHTMDFHLLERQMFPAGSGFSFLVFDCEGCACSFFSEYPNTVNYVRGISLEEDDRHLCDYARLHALFRAANMSIVPRHDRDHTVSIRKHEHVRL
jgi:hypothetical protein